MAMTYTSMVLCAFPFQLHAATVSVPGMLELDLEPSDAGGVMVAQHSTLHRSGDLLTPRTVCRKRFDILYYAEQLPS